MTSAILTIADIITPADAFVLASGECSDWLNRPCCQTIPDDDARSGEPERLRGFGEVNFIQHTDGDTRA